MAKKHGPWLIKSSTLKHKDEWMEFYEDEVVKPDGEPGTFAVVKMLPGVSVLALDAEGFVHLTREFRYAIGRESVEVVSGAIDEGEQASDAARRELREELGIEADEFVDLGLVDAITSQALSRVNIFMARGLRFKQAEQEGTEEIEPLKMKFEEAVAMVLDSRITHGPSCVLILKANSYLRREKKN